ncbi:hypothetical protein GCM10022419_001290 [Nonomuraea rosea]|uniref:Uncharacterized protein n=1 Tax=Nonomuraea rosea TaxID=638574 RepID=A0ABP6V388_9ACTN
MVPGAKATLAPQPVHGWAGVRVGDVTGILSVTGFRQVSGAGLWRRLLASRASLAAVPASQAAGSGGG